MLQQFKVEWHFAGSAHTWDNEHALISKVESVSGYQHEHTRMLEAYQAIKALVKRVGGWCAMSGRTWKPQEYVYEMPWVVLSHYSSEGE